MRNWWLLLLFGVVAVLACQATLWAASPIILGVDVDRTTKSYAPGTLRYGEKITVRVNDADYAEDIGCAIITDSCNPANSVTLSFCRGEGTAINSTAVSFVWKKADTLTPPPAGSYSVYARDLAGNSDTLVTGTPPALPALSLRAVAPAMDSVIYTTPPTAYRPTFQWQNSTTVTKIEVYEEGTQNLVWTKNLAAGIYSVLYANGGTVYYSRTQLLTNHSYVWSINSGTNTAVYSEPADPITGGHAVIVRDWQEAHGRFAIYGSWGTVPLPPALPGTLTYGNQTMTPVVGAWFTSGLMGFTPDPYLRSWLGPEKSDYPDWSPYGDKLLYATPTGLFVDDLSGAPAAWLSGTSGLDTQARWTADRDHIVYSRYVESDPPGTGSYDLWLANADGSDAHAVVSTPANEASPSPSPNGAWIAYQASSDTAEPAVRVVRCDGSDDHAVAATGLTGYDPAFVVTSLSEPAWSPDGTRLAVIFHAQDSVSELVGVGTIPAAGGPVTPRFISDFWTCCAVPQGPGWSPDGASVVFSSGHHKPTLSGYAIANAVELWMVNAEGDPASPTRLTNDYSMTRHLSWWGPNTLPGISVALTREAVTVTFTEVTAAGVTQVLLADQYAGPAPDGFTFASIPYNLSTSASFAGPIAVEVDSAAFGLAPGEDLTPYRLLHWENGRWVDITTTAGTPDRVRGECDALGQFAVALSQTTPAPVADFTAVPTSGVAPLTVYFTDTSSGSPTAWSWDFGDGSASTAQSPSHSYAAGTYTVALTATNAGGANTCTKTDLITVAVPPPTADFSATPVSGTAPLSVSFTDSSSGGPTTWSWDFGDGGTSSEQSPGHTYSTAGVYTVSLTAANAGGSTTAVKTSYISVTPPPPAAAFTADVTTGFVPLTVQFADQSTGDPTAWTWDFGDGTPSHEQNPSHTYTTVGVYTVSLTASNAGGAATETKMGYITVNPPAPVAALSASPTTGPIPLTVQFSDASTGNPTSWEWAFGDGGGSTERNPNHTYTAPGAYTVALTVANAGGTTTDTKVGYVVATVPPPVAEFSATPEQGSVPLTVQFTDLSTGTPTSWSWDFGDGGVSTERHPMHQYVAAGVYTVTLTAGNEGGTNTKVSAGCVTALVPPPVASFSADTTAGIVPLSVQFSDASTGAPTAWTWSFGDGATSTERNPAHAYATPGSYTVSLTATNAGGASTETKVGYISALVPAPVASFTYTPASGDAPLPVQFTDTSSNTPTSWEWSFGDGTTSTAQHPSHTYGAAGTYTVSLTAANGTGANTATVAGAVAVGLAWQFVGPLPPINPDGSSVFKGNKPSVPVQFQLLYTDGTPKTDAYAELFVAPVSYGTVGTYVPAPNASGSGNAFTYSKKTYVFDLATRSLSNGVWSLRIVVNGEVMSTFRITLGK